MSTNLVLPHISHNDANVCILFYVIFITFL